MSIRSGKRDTPNAFVDPSWKIWTSKSTSIQRRHVRTENQNQASWHAEMVEHLFTNHGAFVETPRPRTVGLGSTLNGCNPLHRRARKLTEDTNGCNPLREEKVVKLGGSKAGRVEISPTMGKTLTLTHLKPKCHHDIKSWDKVRKGMFQVTTCFALTSKTTSPAFP